MMDYTIVDHQSRKVQFRGEKILAFESRGHEHMGTHHGLGGALYAKTSPDELVATIDLPGSHLDGSVSSHRHVLVHDHFIDLLGDIDALDVMQHNAMPHWIGSCAMVTADSGGLLHIHIALCRAKVEFMEQCREALSGRFGICKLWPY